MYNINDFDVSVIYTRQDGSYVVNQGMYHVPNEGEWESLWAQVNAYAAEHPDVVRPDPAFEEPTEEELLARAKADSIAQFDAAMSVIDAKLIRPLANGETERVAELNALQAQNRVLRAQVLEATTIDEVKKIHPVSIDGLTNSADGLNMSEESLF